MVVAQRKVSVVNELGMHARPAALFVKAASKFESVIQVGKDGSPVNGKSIMGVLTLAAECGAQLTLTAEGPDAEEAVDALANLIAKGFDE